MRSLTRFPLYFHCHIFTIEVNGIMFVAPRGLVKVHYENFLLEVLSAKEIDQRQAVDSESYELSRVTRALFLKGQIAVESCKEGTQVI